MNANILQPIIKLRLRFKDVAKCRSRSNAAVGFNRDKILTMVGNRVVRR